MLPKLSQPGLHIVGIGEDGWNGLAANAQIALKSAELLIGSRRQLDLIPLNEAERRVWPSPFVPAIHDIIQESHTKNIVVLASGDPLLHGIGATFARYLPDEHFIVYPHVSAFALACARMRWPSEHIPLVSLVHHPIEMLIPYLFHNQRLVVYARDRTTIRTITELFVQHKFGESVLDIFERLAHKDEMHYQVTANTYDRKLALDLYVVALTVKADSGVLPLGRTPGLPDCVFEHDGQITKRSVRAITLAQLSPLPNQLLWDIGAGTGSIGIEWMRVHESCRAIAFEMQEENAQRIGRNAHKLGVPYLRVVLGRAPDTLQGQESPDAIFIGGGLSVDGMLEACWTALQPGGRLVANAVTIEGEAKLIRAREAWGGELTRIELSQAQSLGSMQCWRPALPIVQLVAQK